MCYYLHMIRPAEYNRRIVAHPDVNSNYDSEVCEAARRVLIGAIDLSVPCTITNIAAMLGINRDRASATIRSLGLHGYLLNKKEERAQNISREKRAKDKDTS